MALMFRGSKFSRIALREHFVEREFAVKMPHPHNGRGVHVTCTALENSCTAVRAELRYHRPPRQCVAVCIRWTGLGTGLGTGLWDWTVGLDSQKVALIILKHQNTTKYLHDMNCIWGSRP